MKFHLSNSLFAVLPLTVYGNSHLKSTAVAVELGNQQRALADLKLYEEANPTNNYPLQLCEGDCDNDSQCAGVLVCFQRNNNEPVPGCDGTPTTNDDYCVFPDAEFDVTLATSGCVFTDGGSDNIGNITCTFDTKGGNGAYTVDSALWGTDCISGSAPTGVGLLKDQANTGFDAELVTLSRGQYESSYVVTLPVANNAAANNAAVSTETGSTTNLEFCLKVEVFDKEAGSVYDWTGQKIKLAISLDGQFDTSLSTEAFDGDAAPLANVGSSAFGVDIERCDEDGTTYAGGAALQVGENFYLCVTGNATQVLVDDIDELTATKGTAPNQEEIDLVTTSGFGDNTYVFGEGQNKVIIATRLPIPFFESSGDVTFAGSATISIDSSRRLARSMQAGESADFSMDIEVAAMDDASSASAIRATAAMFFAVVAALII